MLHADKNLDVVYLQKCSILTFKAPITVFGSLAVCLYCVVGYQARGLNS